MIDPGVIQGLQIAQTLTPLVIELVRSLIAAGHTPEEATEMVRRDIASLRDRYEREKADDRAALARKHGRD